MNRHFNRHGRTALLLFAVLLTSACGGGGNSPSPGDGSPPSGGGSSPDLSPDQFTFTEILNAAPGLHVVSREPAVITGIDEGAEVSLQVAKGEYSLNGGAFTQESGSVKNGDKVLVRVQASELEGSKATATLDVGGVTADFTVRTGKPVYEFVEVVPGGLNFDLSIDLDGVDHGRFLYKSNEGDGYVPIGEPVNPAQPNFTQSIAVHRMNWNGGQIALELCDADGHCRLVPGDTLVLEQAMSVPAIASLQGSNTEAGDDFGAAVSLSGDGTQLAIGARYEDGVENGKPSQGSVYLFTNNGDDWTEESILRAINADIGDYFGSGVQLSTDGERVAVGAPGEDSDRSDPLNAPDSTQLVDNDLDDSGAVYIFRRTADGWITESFIKGHQPRTNGKFGWNIALSDSGDVMAVAGFGSHEIDVYRRIGNEWTYDATLKPAWIVSQYLGTGLDISGDGQVIAVGDPLESSKCAGINPVGCESQKSESSGAVAVYRHEGSDWRQTDFIKASNAVDLTLFGWAVSLSEDGSDMVISSSDERSSATGVDGSQDVSDAGFRSGAAYAFHYDADLTAWQQTSYIKASNTGRIDLFGTAVASSGGGDRVVVAADLEDGEGLGVGPLTNANDAENSGALYLYDREPAGWRFVRFVKAAKLMSADSANENMNTLSTDGNGETLVWGRPDADVVFIY